MTNDTIKKIKEIEAQAEEIIKKAKQTVVLAAKKAETNFKHNLDAAKADAQTKKQELLKKTAKEAQSTALQIEQTAKEQVAGIEKSAKNKISQAKEEALQCLL